jgi:hypothetical protein
VPNRFEISGNPIIHHDRTIVSYIHVFQRFFHSARTDIAPVAPQNNTLEVINNLIHKNSKLRTMDTLYPIQFLSPEKVQQMSALARKCSFFGNDIDSQMIGT